MNKLCLDKTAIQNIHFEYGLVLQSKCQEIKKKMRCYSNGLYIFIIFSIQASCCIGQKLSDLFKTGWL